MNNGDEAEILVAGATGNLGGRIVHALRQQDANVTALVRSGADADKIQKLRDESVEITEADLSNADEVARACEGTSCVVSALQGLRDVIVDIQSVLVDGAVKAGVPRFIPSDYSTDFTKLPDGENRNFDLRREFYARLEQTPIAATSILNGAFADMLTGQMPLLDFEGKHVNYWESADVRMDFTTMDDVAAFTAAAALDQSTPRILRIAGDRATARDLAAIASEVVGENFDLVRLGSLGDLASLIEKERARDPEGEKKLYPKRQGMQYVHGMFSGLAQLETLDNNRYPGIKWTSIKEVLASP